LVSFYHAIQLDKIDMLAVVVTEGAAAGSVKVLADIFNKKKANQQTDSNGPQEQLKQYLSSPSLPGDTDPLQWWKTTGKYMYPALVPLVKKYLSMNATSVCSERVFSVAGNIVSKRRSSMDPETVNRLVFLACNLKATE
jgi:hypothetical protein